MKNLKLLLIGSLLLLFSLNANAVSIAYVNASGGNVDYLNSYGHTVSYLNNPIGLTLADLSGYEAVMVASNSIFTEGTNIGNVLADFVDAGGALVMTEFVYQGVWALGGRVMTSGYSPFTIDPLSSGYYINSTLGTIYDPASDLFAGVNTANVGTNYQANVGLDTGAALVADWDSLRHALAYNALVDSTIVGLNLFPGIVPNADTQRLVANAIDFSVNNVSVPEPPTLALISLGLLGLGYRRKKTLSC